MSQSTGMVSVFFKCWFIASDPWAADDMICSKPGKSTWQGYWPGHPRARHTRFHDRLQYGQVLIGHSGHENAVYYNPFSDVGRNLFGCHAAHVIKPTMRVSCQHWLESNFHCSHWWWTVAQHGIIHTFEPISTTHGAKSSTTLFNREFMRAPTVICEPGPRHFCQLLFQGLLRRCYTQTFGNSIGCGGALYGTVVELSRSGIDRIQWGAILGFNQE